MQDSAGAKHTVFIEDLLGKQVQTAAGRTLGRVFELSLSSGPDYGVESLLLGSAGLADRFDVSRAVFYHLTPDFTPIEQAFSKIKAILRGLGARTKEALQEAVRLAIEAITRHDAAAWFAHAGYALPAQAT